MVGYLPSAPRKRKRWPWILIILALILAGLFFLLQRPANTREGVDYVFRERPIPLYLKLLTFFSRHYQFKYLAQQITLGAPTGEEKLLGILRWVRANIRFGTPEGLPVRDDHILNVIIRGYGEGDQVGDVFTTLATYAGYRSATYRLHAPDGTKGPTVAVVELGGRMLLFDTYLGVVFRNARGQLASLDDLRADPSIAQRAVGSARFRGRPYSDFYKRLSQLKALPPIIKPELQMPLRRVVYEVSRKLGLMQRARARFGGSPSP